METTNMTGFDTPQAVVLIVGLALVLLLAGGKAFATVNVGMG